jgi:hypothetical protein
VLLSVVDMAILVAVMVAVVVMLVMMVVVVVVVTAWLSLVVCGAEKHQDPPPPRTPQTCRTPTPIIPSQISIKPSVPAVLVDLGGRQGREHPHLRSRSEKTSTATETGE